MKPFRVTWSIEVDAENDFDAALLASKIITVPKNRFDIFNANRFMVTEIGTIDTTVVDLSEKDIVDFNNIENENTNN